MTDQLSVGYWLGAIDRGVIGLESTLFLSNILFINPAYILSNVIFIYPTSVIH